MCSQKRLSTTSSGYTENLSPTFHILDHKDKIRLRTFQSHHFLALRSAPCRAELSIGQLREPLTLLESQDDLAHRHSGDIPCPRSRKEEDRVLTCESMVCSCPHHLERRQINSFAQS